MFLRRIQRSIAFLLLLSLPFILIWSVPGRSAEAASPIYMRPDGDDLQCNGLVDAPYPGSGTGQPCAFQTFWKAHNEVDDPGIIYVGAGTYTEVFTIGKSVTVIGAGVDQTIIDGGGKIIIGGLTTSPIISNFTVQNVDSPPGEGGGVVIFSGNGTVTLRDCVVQNNQTWAGGGSPIWEI